MTWYIIGGTVAVLFATGTCFGVAKIRHDIRHWREDVGRDKAPWERNDPGA